MRGHEVTIQATQARFVDIPFIPPQVDFAHLHDNYKLLSDDQVKAVLEQKLADGSRNKKTNINQKYDISYVDGNYYAIYLGKKHGTLLGESSFGVVKLAQNIVTGEWVAIKILNDENEDENKKNEKEQGLLTLFEKLKGRYHREVIPLASSSKKHKNQVEILLTYESGANLDAFFKLNKELSFIQLLNLALQLIREVKKIHDKGVIHKDLHRGNIMYDRSSGRLSVIDYGEAIVIGPQNDHEDVKKRINDDITDVMNILSNLFGLSYSRATCQFEEATELDDGCDLHRMSDLPLNLNDYKSCYILVKDKLYYINKRSEAESVTINDFDSLNEKLHDIPYADRQQVGSPYLCNLYSMQVVPQELDNYKNSYIIVGQQLYYIGTDAVCEEVKIDNFQMMREDFDKRIEEAKMRNEDRAVLYFRDIKKFITHNGGHVPRKVRLTKLDVHRFITLNGGHPHPQDIWLPLKIQNSEIRHRVKNILKCMNFLHCSPPPIDEAGILQEFQEIHDTCLDFYSRIIKVGYINIREYQEASQNQKLAILAALKVVDEIHFIDNSVSPNVRDYCVIKREFEKMGFSVANKVIQYCTNESLARLMAAPIDVNNALPRRINARYLISSRVVEASLQEQLDYAGVIPIIITDKPNLKNEALLTRESALPLDNSTLINIVQALQQEKNRLFFSKSWPMGSRPERLKLLNKTIHSLELIGQSGSLRYESVKSLLDLLERDLQRYSWRPKVFGHKLTLYTTKTQVCAINTLRLLETGNESKADTQAERSSGEDKAGSTNNKRQSS